MSSSGNSFSNFSISSSPVTFTSVSLPLIDGVSKSSNEKLPLDATGAPDGADGTGMSPSNSMSGKAEMACSKSISSPAAVAKEPPVSVGVENSSPSSSLSRARKSVIVVAGTGNKQQASQCALQER